MDADRKAFEEKYDQCWRCVRPTLRSRVGSLYGARAFYKRPTCEYCQGIAFGVRRQWFPEMDVTGKGHGGPIRYRQAHEFEKNAQMHAIYLGFLLISLKKEIRLAARIL
jgi:hypothetical protein